MELINLAYDIKSVAKKNNTNSLVVVALCAIALVVDKIEFLVDKVKYGKLQQEIADASIKYYQEEIEKDADKWYLVHFKKLLV